MSEFIFKELVPASKSETSFRKISEEGLRLEKISGREILRVEPEAIKKLTEEAFRDVMHLLRPKHLEQVAKIIADPEASDNDRYVATTLLENAMIAAEGIFPGCQDTGTAIVMAKKGENVWTEEDDEKSISEGIYRSYQNNNFRFSQLAPLDMYTEKNTGSNLPAQIEIYSKKGNEYEFLFIAKGGGSANKSLLFQQTKAVLNPLSL